MNQPNAMATKKAATTMDNRPRTTRMNGVSAHARFKYCLIVIFIVLSRMLEAKVVNKVV